MLSVILLLMISVWLSSIYFSSISCYNENNSLLVCSTLPCFYGLINCLDAPSGELLTPRMQSVSKLDLILNTFYILYKASRFDRWKNIEQIQSGFAPHASNQAPDPVTVSDKICVLKRPRHSDDPALCFVCSYGWKVPSSSRRMFSEP